MEENARIRSISPQAASETTPLLSNPPVHSDQSNEDGQSNPSSEESSSEARPRAPRSILILTSLSLLLSIITFALIVAFNILNLHPPDGYYLYWPIEEALRGVLAITVIVAFFSILNLIRLRLHSYALPLWVNLILDLGFTFYTIGFSVQGLSENSSGYGYSCSQGYHDKYDEATCEAWAKQNQVLVGFAMGFGLALGIVHLVLFLIRCVAAYRTEFWQRPWSIPTGQLTLEFTVKLLRQEHTER